MQTTPQRGTVPASERVVRSVAAYTETDLLELPCLFDVIDTEALDTLVESTDDGQVRFRYAGCDVTVRHDGTVDVLETVHADARAKTTEGNGREHAQD